MKNSSRLIGRKVYKEFCPIVIIFRPYLNLIPSEKGGGGIKSYVKLLSPGRPLPNIIS
jgi:hypothetical protein